jgi:formylglycine-generating enzyme required for sulfatase activity
MRPTPGAAVEARRVALVIGNARYGADRLLNPIGDAETVSRMLRTLGFEVLAYTDVDGPQMTQAIGQFSRHLKAGGVGLFYFAGHGLSVGERTLLVPVDADRRSPARLITHGVALRNVLDVMSAPRPGKVNLVILDTCLSDPFQPGGRGAPDALPEQTLIAYATAPGSLAADGAELGRFTEAFLGQIAVPDQDVEQAFRRVASIVSRDTAGAQIPWTASSLSAGFRFTTAPPGSGAAPLAALAQSDTDLPARSRGILPKDSAEQYELTFWDSIKDSQHASDYEAYLKAYPNGRFAALARARIERLRAATPKIETPSPRPAPAAPPPAERPRPAAPAAPAAPPAVERPRPAPAVAPAPEKPRSAAVALTEIKDCPECPAMVGLPRGDFVMGSNTDDPSERPAHPVSIAQPFAIGKYEVTNEQWNACAEAGACPRLSSDASTAKNAPARDLSWDDAQQYVKWLSSATGKSYRLPTEAEWEYAIRGGTSTRYWWGTQMRTGNANCKDCGEPSRPDGPATVGSFAPNPYGLYDMNGSVWEWVSDCWHNSYKGAPADGRSWEDADCRVRVIRGGSWREGADYMLSSTRFKYGASVRHSQNGFRVAREVK